MATGRAFEKDAGKADRSGIKSDDIRCGRPLPRSERKPGADIEQQVGAENSQGIHHRVIVDPDQRILSITSDTGETVCAIIELVPAIVRIPEIHALFLAEVLIYASDPVAEVIHAGIGTCDEVVELQIRAADIRAPDML